MRISISMISQLIENFEILNLMKELEMMVTEKIKDELVIKAETFIFRKMNRSFKKACL